MRPASHELQWRAVRASSLGRPRSAEIRKANANELADGDALPASGAPIHLLPKTNEKLLVHGTRRRPLPWLRRAATSGQLFETLRRTQSLSPSWAEQTVQRRLFLPAPGRRQAHGAPCRFRHFPALVPGHAHDLGSAVASLHPARRSGLAAAAISVHPAFWRSTHATWLVSREAKALQAEGADPQASPLRLGPFLRGGCRNQGLPWPDLRPPSAS